MNSDQLTNGIPNSLRPYFQEYDFTGLTVGTHAELVIERALNYGNRTELRWLFGQYGWQRITEWVAERGAQRLSRRRYRLWCVLLEVPPTPLRKTSIWPH